MFNWAALPLLRAVPAEHTGHNDQMVYFGKGEIWGEKQRPRTVLLGCGDAAVVGEGYASTSSSAKGSPLRGAL